jgi:hypothetical protein
MLELIKDIIQQNGWILQKMQSTLPIIKII